MRNVKEFRSKSKRAATHALAEYPDRYNVEVIPDGPFLCVPKVSSERREYVPIGWLQPPTIPSDLVFVLKDAELTHFGVLTSRAHMAWLRHIGGKMKSDFRYSIGIVYNTFPWPAISEKQNLELTKLAQSILKLRSDFSNETLATLYDPDLMPSNLRKSVSN